MSDVTVIKSSKDRLRDAMGNNQWLSQEILNQTVNIIALYTQRIQTLEYRSARERIIAEIIYLAKRFGKEHGKAIIIDAPITHQDIADSISMNRETASRALESLFEEGYLVQINHYFSVMNIDKLQAFIS